MLYYSTQHCPTSTGIPCYLYLPEILIAMQLSAFPYGWPKTEIKRDDISLIPISIHSAYIYKN